MMAGQKYFIFVDETGTNKSDRFFGIGCLLIPVDKMGAYHDLLSVKLSQILTMVKAKEAELEGKLTRVDLANFYKGRSDPYEMKFKYINTTTQEGYSWLISQYFKLSDLKFCCLVIDREQDYPPPGFDYFDLYIQRLFMLLKNNVDDEDEFVILPDEITTPKGKSYEEALMVKLRANGKKCFGIHRLESHSSIFLQMVDVLTGACVHSFKGTVHASKQFIVDKIIKKLGVSNLNCAFTKKTPNYFSIWPYKPKK